MRRSISFTTNSHTRRGEVQWVCAGVCEDADMTRHLSVVRMHSKDTNVHISSAL